LKLAGDQNIQDTVFRVPASAGKSLAPGSFQLMVFEN